MTPILLLDPLTPSPDEARSQLRRELLHPDYHRDDLLGRLLDWVMGLISRALTAASQAPPLSTLVAMLLGLVLVGALLWLLSRARGSRRAAADRAPVLPDRTVSAARWRQLADEAMLQERFGDALVHGFRAFVAGQVEAGLLADSPGATAHEVVRALEQVAPGRHPGLAPAADRFDQVLYGDRPATREQAAAVLALDAHPAGAA